MERLDVTKKIMKRFDFEWRNGAYSQLSTPLMLNKIASIITEMREVYPTICPHCGGYVHESKGWYRGQLHRWACKKCGKTFSDISGLPFENISKIKEFATFWHDEMYEQLSAKQAAEFLGVNFKTIYQWQQKKERLKHAN